MTTPTTNTESEVTNGDTNGNENLSFDTNQISSDEQLSQIIDSINLSTATTCEDSNTDESQSKSSTIASTTRTPGQTAIGAKLVKKLETFAANSKDNKQTNGKTPQSSNTTATANVASSTTNNETESRRNITKAASMLKFNRNFLLISPI